MIDALLAAARDLFRGRMLALVFWPLLAALAVWIALGVVLWPWLVEWLRRLIGFGAAHAWLAASLAKGLSAAVVFVALLAVIPPLVLATALFVTSLVAMPVIVRDVTAREYPRLERCFGGSAAGSVGNAFGATAIYLALWLLTLPLWLFVLPAGLLPVLLGGWLNQRLFRYDALAEHAGREEFRRLVRESRAELMGLGIVAAMLQMVPIVNLFSPVYSGLSFAHFALARLERQRAGSLRQGLS